MLESIGSARLEGNHTTVAEYIEKKISSDQFKDEKDTEIENIEKAMALIDENIEHMPLNGLFLNELHKQVVKNLTPPPSTGQNPCSSSP